MGSSREAAKSSQMARVPSPDFGSLWARLLNIKKEVVPSGQKGEAINVQKVAESQVWLESAQFPVIFFWRGGGYRLKFGHHLVKFWLVTRIVEYNTG